MSIFFLISLACLPNVYTADHFSFFFGHTHYRENRYPILLGSVKVAAFSQGRRAPISGKKSRQGCSSTKGRCGAATLPTTILSHYSGVYYRQKCHLIGKRLMEQTTFTAGDTGAGLFIGVIQQDGAYYGIKISAYWEA